MPKIILGSQSPRRKELLRNMGISDFEIIVPTCDESYPDGLSPQETVCYISRKKSEAIPCGEDSVVITADTMVFLGDRRLGKPKDREDALQMLLALQGCCHTVCTGVTVRNRETAETFAVTTAVYFRPCTREELLAYIDGGEPMDKAGAYGIQQQGALLVERIEGDYFNVVGLPVSRLGQVLKQFGVDLI